MRQSAARKPKPAPTGNSVVTISTRGAARLCAGHVWVYRSDLLNPAEAHAGAVLDVAEERGRVLGTALYSSASVIALRLISRHAIPEGDVVAQLIPERIRAAIEYRRQMVRDSDAYRVIFSEGDGLPGLIVDRYNDIASVQVLTQAFDRADFRQAILDRLAAELP